MLTLEVNGKPSSSSSSSPLPLLPLSYHTQQFFVGHQQYSYEYKYINKYTICIFRIFYACIVFVTFSRLVSRAGREREKANTGGKDGGSFVARSWLISGCPIEI